MSAWVLVTLVVELPLLAHMLWHWRGEAAYRSNPTTWLGYCWVHAGKVVVLFVRVMPRLPNQLGQQLLKENEVQDLFGLLQVDFTQLFSPTMLGNLLYITPVVYALLMFRTSRAIFGKFSNNVTLDLILHYDLLWHVVIDMVDQVDMLSLARVAEWADKAVYAESRQTLVLIQTLVPFLLFVSMVLQAQAFPGVVVDRWKIPPTSPKIPPTSTNFHVPQHHEQGPRFIETQQDGWGVPPNRNESVVSFRTWATTEHAVRSSDGPTNTEDGQNEGLSLPPAEPPPAPVLGHRAPVMSADGPPSFEDLLTPPPAFAEATDTPQQLRLPPMSAEPGGDAAPPRLRLPGVSRTRVDSDISGALPRGGTAVAILGSGDLGTKRPQTWGNPRENLLREERDRRRRLQAIVHAIRRQSIIIARKRSAIVSIFFTDVPFLSLRLWVFTLVGQSYFHGLFIKNVIGATPSLCRSNRYATAVKAACSSSVSTPVGQAAEREKAAKGMRLQRSLAANKVQRERVQSPGVCGYFWAMLLPFLAGLLLSKGEWFIIKIFRLLQDLIDNEQPSVGPATAAMTETRIATVQLWQRLRLTATAFDFPADSNSCLRV
eukprot:CAMPEP_0172786834 /NCGR_PEP_ID=MMETSP1074-20121228/206145_1 /TAXON_ID=2916 /ORGANISM="Ceratium fusus, Strain PA161109" /LENGTH=599 /DNA_ID=CAMNT_0013623849 /DNA_START=242 /DNA_END=2042 /DNA_ORIENTATION=+